MILWYQDKRKWHCPHNSPPKPVSPALSYIPCSAEGLKLVLRALQGQGVGPPSPPVRAVLKEQGIGTHG